jgi:tellurite resistance protein
MTDKPTDQEDAYFRKQDQELRQRLRDQLSTAAGDLKQRQGSELSIPQRLEALGFAGAKLQVFDLMPLIHVAWADGSVSRREKTAILDVVRERGIAPGSDAYLLVETLLEARPAEQFLTESLAILRDVIGDARAENIVELCLQVANASGGFMNIGAVSPDERRQIEAIAGKLGPAALDAFHRELG